MKKRSTLKDLERMHAQGNVKVNNWKAPPSLPFPEEKKRGRKPVEKGPKINTTDLTNATINYFRAKGFWCWRNNNGAVYDPTIGRFRKNSVLRGVSDIIGYHRRTGVALFVEIKNVHTRDKKSDEQDAFLEGARQAGCHVFVVTGMNDLV